MENLHTPAFADWVNPDPRLVDKMAREIARCFGLDPEQLITMVEPYKSFAGCFVAVGDTMPSYQHFIPMAKHLVSFIMNDEIVRSERLFRAIEKVSEEKSDEEKVLSD